MVTSPFELKQGLFGAPRIGLRVRQPINTSSVVNVALLNAALLSPCASAVSAGLLVRLEPGVPVPKLLLQLRNAVGQPGP